jgi:flagellar L-ring protein precursor FlgH
MKLTPFILIAAAILAGCATTPDTITHQPSAARAEPVRAMTPPPANGSIFQVGAYRPMFEDRRARHVGDIITIAVNERTSAGKAVGNSASKSGSTNTGISKLFGVPAATVAQLGAGASTDNKFEEKGAASTSNNFSGTITVSVVDVMPNGNLLVSGEKQIAFDKGSEFVRFSGIVNPDTITGGNVVSSTQVADARVEYRTNSRIDKSEIMSQLARFFYSFAPL